MKYCIFIDIDFCTNAGHLIKHILHEDHSAEFCILQGTTRNALDSLIETIPKEVRLPEDIPDLNELEMQWAHYGDESRLEHFENKLGSQVVNECQIAGKYLGHGYLQEGHLPHSPLHAVFQNKSAQRRYLSGMLEFYIEYLRKEQPDMVFTVSVDRSYLAGLGVVCNYLGIKFRRMLNIRIQGYYTFSPTIRETVPHIRNEYERYLSGVREKDEAIEKAQEVLAGFKSSPAAPDIQKMSLNMLHRRLPLKTVAIMLIQALHPTYSPKGVQVAYPGEFLKTYFKRRWRFKYEYKKERWKTFDSIKGRKFAYYPLHFSPEATTMVYSPMMTNQLAIIEAFSKSIPASWSLAVKEHKSMMGRRPTEFYEALTRMPKVELIHPFDNQYKYLNNAELIATITGTTAIEAMAFGKVPLLFGPSIVRLIKEGFVQCSDFVKMPAAVDEALQAKPVDPDKFLFLLAAFIKSSFPVASPLLFETSQMPISAGERDTIFKELAKRLVQSVDDEDYDLSQCADWFCS